MSTKRVLIVEDEPVTAMAERSMVQKLGYEVTAIFTSGEAAIENFGREIPDLILLDIKLSGEMDGTQFAQEIQKQYDIPIIFITAYGDKRRSNPDELDLPKGYGFIVKPFTEPELANHIRRLLGKDLTQKTRH